MSSTAGAARKFSIEPVGVIEQTQHRAFVGIGVDYAVCCCIVVDLANPGPDGKALSERGRESVQIAVSRRDICSKRGLLCGPVFDLGQARSQIDESRPNFATRRRIFKDGEILINDRLLC